jgi:hypothetical protein
VNQVKTNIDPIQPKVNTESTQSQQLVTPKSTEVIEKVSHEFTCKYCNQKFTFRQSMNRHMNYTCTKNKDEDLRTQVYLLKKQIDEQQQLLDEQIQMIDGVSEKIEKILKLADQDEYFQ